MRHDESERRSVFTQAGMQHVRAVGAAGVRVLLLLCLFAGVARAQSGTPNLPVGTEIEECGFAITLPLTRIGGVPNASICELHKRNEAVAPWLFPRLVRGFVAAMGYPPGETEPEWQELREDAPPTTVATGDYAVMSAATYNELVKAYNDFRQANPSGWAIKSRSEYESLRCAPVGDARTPPALPTGTGALGVFSVIVRDTAAAIERCDTLLMFTTPLNLRGTVDVESATSLLIDPISRRIVYRSPGRLTRRSGYFQPPEHPVWCKDAQGDPDKIFASCPSRLFKDTGVWRPIGGVEVGYRYGYSPIPLFAGRDLKGTLVKTDQRGYYSAINPQGINLILAKVDLSFPDPSRKPIRTVFAGQPAIFPTDANQDMIYGSGPVHEVYTTDPERYRVYTNIGVNVALISTELSLSNEGAASGGPVAVGDTTEFSHQELLPDCDDPRVRRPGPGVCSDDPTRRFLHQGLVRQISARDLRNTDVYVFRESDGALGVAQYGLPASSLPDGATAAKVSVMVPLGGLKTLRRYLIHGKDLFATQDPTDPRNHLTRTIEQIRAAHGPVDGEGKLIEGLRYGDSVLVVALNRATGYVATCHTDVAGQTTGGAASIHCPAMQMRPPNLRIQAERASKIEVGERRGQLRTTLIGFEGAARTTDTYVMVKTQWYDHDGSALPSALPGLQGRLARVCGAGQLRRECGRSSDLGYFTVTPGTSTELLAVPDDDQMEQAHFYVHVDAADPATIDAAENKPFPQNQVCYKPDPDDPGPVCVDEASGDEPLDERPADFVPFRVAFFDKAATDAARDEEHGGHPDADAIYQYFYRPELSFSVLDLELESLQKTDASGQVHDLTEALQSEDAKPIFLGPEDLSLDLVLSLLQDEAPALSRIDTPRQMLLLAGDKEILVKLDQSHTLQLDQEALGQLGADDLSALRLVQRYDEENILWQFAFATFVLIPAGNPADAAGTDPENEILVSADDVTGLANASVLDGKKDGRNPYTAEWFIEGSASLVSPSSATETSLTRSFQASFQLSRIAGQRARLGVALADGLSGAPRYTPWYRTIPGAPHTISISSETGETALGEWGGRTVRLLVTDAHGNTVAPGNSITVEAPNLDVRGPDDEEPKLETNDSGVIVLKFVGLTVAGANTVTLRVGGAVRTFVVTVHDVNLELQLAAAQVPIDGTMGAAIQATSPTLQQPLAGLQVKLSAFRSHASASDLTLDGQGRAQVTLTASSSAGPAMFYANVAEKMEEAAFTVAPTDDVGIAHNVLVSDRATDGTFPYTLPDGQQVGIPYFTATQVVVTGQPGEQIDVELGSSRAPNRLPVVEYPLQTLVGVVVPEVFEGLDGTATASGVTPLELGDGPEGKRRGLQFAANGAVTTPRDPKLDLANGVVLSFWIRLTSSPSEERPLVRLGHRRLQARVGTNNQLLVEAELATGRVVVPTGPLNVGNWNLVTLGLRNGELFASVDDDHYSTAATGDLLPDARVSYGLQLGGGAEVSLAMVSLYNWASSPVLKLGDGAQAGAFVVGSNGEARFSVAATGPTSTAVERIQRRLQRQYRNTAEDALVATAYAAEISELCGQPPPKFQSAYEAGTRLVEYMQECDFLSGLKRQIIRVKKADGILDRVVQTSELIGYLNLTGAVLATRAIASAPDCVRGFVTGNTETTAGAVCDFASGFFVVGDIRDFILQEIYLYTESRDDQGKPKYDVATHTLAGLGLIAALGTALTAGAAVPAKIVVNAAKTATKLLRGLGGVMVDFVRVSFRWLKRAVLEAPGSTTERFKLLNKALPFIQLLAALGFQWNEFRQAGRVVAALVVNAPQHIDALVEYLAGVVAWWDSAGLSEESEDPVARYGGLVGIAYAQAFLARQPVRLVLARLERLAAGRAGVASEQLGDELAKVITTLRSVDPNSAHPELINSLYKQKTFRAFDHMARLEDKLYRAQGNSSLPIQLDIDVMMMLRNANTRVPPPATGVSVDRLLDDIAEMDPAVLDAMTPPQLEGFAKTLSQLDPRRKRPLDDELTEGQVDAFLWKSEGTMFETSVITQLAKKNGAMPNGMQAKQVIKNAHDREVGSRIADLHADLNVLSPGFKLPAGERLIDCKAVDPSNIELHVVLDLKSTNRTGGQGYRDLVDQLKRGMEVDEGVPSWPQAKRGEFNRTMLFAKGDPETVKGLPKLVTDTILDSGNTKLLERLAGDLQIDSNVLARRLRTELPILLENAYRVMP